MEKKKTAYKEVETLIYENLPDEYKNLEKEVVKESVLSVLRKGYREFHYPDKTYFHFETINIGFTSPPNTQIVEVMENAGLLKAFTSEEYGRSRPLAPQVLLVMGYPHHLTLKGEKLVQRLYEEGVFREYDEKKTLEKRREEPRREEARKCLRGR